MLDLQNTNSQSPVTMGTIAEYICLEVNDQLRLDSDIEISDISEPLIKTRLEGLTVVVTSCDVAGMFQYHGLDCNYYKTEPGRSELCNIWEFDADVIVKDVINMVYTLSSEYPRTCGTVCGIENVVLERVREGDRFDMYKVDFTFTISKIIN